MSLDAGQVARPNAMVGRGKLSVVDDTTFDRLARQHMRAVTAYARAIGRDRWAAEEAVQETFLRAWKYVDSFHGAGSFEGWLLRICRRCVIDQAGKYMEVEPLDDANGEHLRAVNTEGYADTADLVRRLPLPQREALVLCTVLGYDYDQAAVLLGVPVGTIRSRIHRARTSLDVRLSESVQETA